MTVRDLCDVVYVLLLEQLERQVLVDRQVAAAHNTSGRFEPVPLPSWHEHRQRFDEALEADPAVSPVSSLSVEQRELREALGVLR